MNKKELVDKVSKKAGLKKKDVKKVVDMVFDTVTDALAKGEKVQLVGFGSFEVRKAAQRKGVNPQTKKPITIPSRKVPKFKPGKALKEKVK
ncbi:MULTISPECIES: DNA-binding protein HU [Pseudothermotoga]|jgi:DNA-binding protein HU-beta|uniref:Histone family protein DNA-binding protein n=1 Tax=Pseudothermotoga lettingae (strain ATCC BAA-301 / DSM 14385 / NBRC 107922 / TMO) TaxID=416591 RepID=A8F733_PSELT|nr:MULTISPECIES: DNA-binding protein HU [Pseudothermotoga]ABV33967.1 histone family protein DNA-binding protein [Pseudothermotoga lettingae TMO]KUK20987.1 MAG: Histone family protein DNA-binding protein [Pseudothermotoga lettingae]MDI3494654.1 DNA-binding protein HU-beta [Pseudothermotoga sp.]MDK2884591.1 DNA-binding protein HU-beta [Pseudothermotoga sp.]GLI49095.1 DNA-binding protein HU [Pseudothermotoga lettingae TMO]